MFICRDIETLIILQILAKFAKTWGTIVIQYGKRFLMLSPDEDDQFSKAATINHRLEHINHLARQFFQKTPNFCSYLHVRVILHSIILDLGTVPVG